ncbi:hypothetical protein V2J09_010091 [Rumex salicifolius]
MIADKFQVYNLTDEAALSASSYGPVGCVDDCRQVSGYFFNLLSKLPMSQELALLYLELPLNISMSIDALQPIEDVAKQYLATHYKDLTNASDGVSIANGTADLGRTNDSDSDVPMEDIGETSDSRTSDTEPVPQATKLGTRQRRVPACLAYASSCVSCCQFVSSNWPVGTGVSGQLHLLFDASLSTIPSLVEFVNRSKLTRKEAMALPLQALEVVLSSDDMQVSEEDSVCAFILEWARAHYPNLEERRKIIAKHYDS